MYKVCACVHVYVSLNVDLRLCVGIRVGVRLGLGAFARESECV